MVQPRSVKKTTVKEVNGKDNVLAADVKEPETKRPYVPARFQKFKNLFTQNCESDQPRTYITRTGTPPLRELTKASYVDRGGAFGDNRDYDLKMGGKSTFFAEKTWAVVFLSIVFSLVLHLILDSNRPESRADRVKVVMDHTVKQISFTIKVICISWGCWWLLRTKERDNSRLLEGVRSRDTRLIPIDESSTDDPLLNSYKLKPQEATHSIERAPAETPRRTNAKLNPIISPGCKVASSTVSHLSSSIYEVSAPANAGDQRSEETSLQLKATVEPVLIVTSEGRVKEEMGREGEDDEDVDVDGDDDNGEEEEDEDEDKDVDVDVDMEVEMEGKVQVEAVEEGNTEHTEAQGRTKLQEKVKDKETEEKYETKDDEQNMQISTQIHPLSENLAPVIVPEGERNNGDIEDTKDTPEEGSNNESEDNEGTEEDHNDIEYPQMNQQISEAPVKASSQYETPEPRRDPRNREFYVPGMVEGIPVFAIPDFGSGFNIVSEELANQHGLTIDTGYTESYELPNGIIGGFIGTIRVAWSFLNEEATYNCVFHVMQNCICNMILGRDFLDSTKTFTEYVHRRVQVRYRDQHGPSSIRRVLFVDQPSPSSRQRLLGEVDGHPIGGFTDTCSDLTIIRKSTAIQLARKLGWEIDWGSRTEVQFVDRSTAFTSGLIHGVTWGFSADPRQEDTLRIDLHIMESTPCALILDRLLLWDYQAFTRYAYCFIDIGNGDKVGAKKPILWIGEKRRHEPALETVSPADEEATRRTRVIDEIEELPSHQRAAARVEESRRIQQWEAVHGPLSTVVGSPSLITTTNTPSLPTTQTASPLSTSSGPHHNPTASSQSSSSVSSSTVGVSSSSNSSTSTPPPDTTVVVKKKKRFNKFRKRR
ncbi:hypothetical protein EMCG_03370 [[Emmonsia] crescens]|uniref:Uncharacterized protein n=1 Tax=[Emmonsia] crescens TaxID=73230 RepID=A0A0G2J8F2_9EURO|nr:hypothetical protein EMCG_03370 [Emmonsia crescens UAMH 3008]